MTFAENIIKLTDYPFLYSIVPLYLAYTNTNILELDDSRLFLFLGMISIIGMILTILDPVGWIIREWQIHWKYWLSYLIRYIKWHSGKKILLNLHGSYIGLTKK